MRNALIVLVVVALVLVALGAFNNDLLFDVDLVAGTWTAVSLFWVAVVTAGVVVVSGLAAAFLARSSAVTTRRKLEKELQATYERLRAAEAQVPRLASVQAAVVDVTSGEQTAVTGVGPAAAPEAETVVEATAPADDETAAISAPADDETAVISAAPDADTAALDATPAEDASPPAES